MVISCQIDEITLEGDYTEIDSVQATCSQCHHTTESYGTSQDSIKRYLALMREECPQKELNYYVDAQTYNASIRKQRKTRKQLTPEMVELLASMEYHR